MAYEVDYYILDQKMRPVIEKSSAEWTQGLEESLKSALNIVNNGNIKGDAAESIKLYFSEVYGLIISGMFSILSTQVQNFTHYIAEYYQNVDTDEEARINSDELEYIKSRLNVSRLAALDSDIRAEKALIGISDIFTFPFTDVREVDETHKAAIDELTALDTKINELESRHMSSDFSLVEDAIRKTTALINEQLSKPKGYMDSLTPESLMQSAAFIEAYTVFGALDTQRSKNKAQFEADLKVVNKHDRDLQKVIEERQRKANRKKMILGVGLALVTTVITGGVGGGVIVSVLVGGGVGAATGAIGDGMGEYWNQQAITGGREYNWNKIGKEATVGAIKGGVKGSVSSLSGAGFKKIKGMGVIKRGYESSSALARGGTRFAVGGVKSISEGVVNRAAGSAAHDLVYEGKIHGKDVVKETFDGSEVIKDGIKGGLGEMREMKLGPKNKDAGDNKLEQGLGAMNDKAERMDNGSLAERIIGGSVENGAKEVAGGIVDRTVDSVVDDLADDGKLNGREILHNVLDKDEIIKDAVQGSAKGGLEGVKSYGEDKKKGFDIKKEYTTDYLDENKKLRPNIRFSVSDTRRDGNNRLMYETDSQGRVCVKHDNKTGYNTKIYYADSERREVTEKINTESSLLHKDKDRYRSEHTTGLNSEGRAESFSSRTYKYDAKEHSETHSRTGYSASQPRTSYDYASRTLERKRGSEKLEVFESGHEWSDGSGSYDERDFRNGNGTSREGVGFSYEHRFYNAKSRTGKIYMHRSEVEVDR